MSEKRICVAGIGAVGGLLAAMLGKIHGQQLTLYARPNKAKLLRENGLHLHSEFYGEVCSTPGNICDHPAEIGPQDVLFICVKNYSLEQVLDDLCAHFGVEVPA